MPDARPQRRTIAQRKSPACERLSRDNLDARAPEAFHEAFGPNGRLRIEFRRTPKRGSRLNVAENELETRQSLRRLGETLRAEISAWAVDVNERQRGAADENRRRELT